MGTTITDSPPLLPPDISYKDYTRRRVFGSEQEYSISIINEKGRPFYLRSEDLDHGKFWRFTDGKLARFLPNGCRVYIDTGQHQEYASPEVSDPWRAMIYDQVGDYIISRYLEPTNKSHKLRIFKHNADSNGNFYGSHESYSLAPIDMNYLAFATTTYLTTRIIFTGSGLLDDEGNYFISQKGNSINTEKSVNTIKEKPIFNTRDEPLADKDKYKRLHVVSGDASISQFSSLAKLGITGLILDMLEDKKLPLLEISDPLNAFKTISSDLEFKQKYTVTKRKLEHGLLNYSDNHKNITSYEGIDELTAIDIQRIYQKTADDLYKGRDRLTDYLIEYWDFILSALSLDYKILSKHLDWVIKKNLIDEYKNKHPDRIDKCLLINLRYHEIGEGGLFHILESEGEVETILSSDEIEPYIETPPHDTRARIRGWIASINNNHILNTSNLNHNHFFIIKDIDWHWFRYQTKDKGICICPYPYNEGNKCVNFKCTLQKLDDPLDAYEGLESKLLNGKRI